MSRARLKKQLAGRKLKLTSLMEHVYPPADEAQHKKDLERFRGVFRLAQDLAGDEPPVVQTVLGGGRFEDKKRMIVDRVGDWVELGKKHGIVTCIKPHRGGCVSQPSEGIQILKELAEPKWLPRGTRLRAIGVYDNSAANPANPDPKREVFFGLQSDEEMFIGFFEVIWNAPKPAATRD